MGTTSRTLKITVVVVDHLGLYDDKVRARSEQEFPPETTVAVVKSWTARTVANAIRDAQRSFPLDAIVEEKTTDDKTLRDITDDDADQLSEMAF